MLMWRYLNKTPYPSAWRAQIFHGGDLHGPGGDQEKPRSSSQAPGMYALFAVAKTLTRIAVGDRCYSMTIADHSADGSRRTI